jgi:glycosyltransferase involved in cell wall biosynthesis
VHPQLWRAERLRVVHVFKTYFPDSFFGIERVIWNIAQGTRGLDAQHSVLTLSPNPNPAPLRVGDHFVFQARQDLHVSSTGLSLAAVGLYRRLVAANDVVHYHFPWPMMDLLHLGFGNGRPSVVTYHSDVVKQRRLLKLYSPVMHRFLASVDHIVATSPQYYETSEVLRRYREKTSIIPIGLQRDRREVRPEVRDRWRERLGRDFFLFVGVPRYYKGMPYLLEAARLAGVRLVLAGVPAEFAGGVLDDRIVSLGCITDEDKEALLDLCRAVVLASHLRSEAYGLTLVEAARAGRAMICCELGTGTTYVNAAGVTGLVVPPADAAPLAAALRTLDADRELAAAYGRAARRRFEQFFDASDMGRSYFEIYKTVAARAARRFTA